MKKQILAVGDSFTYGDELADHYQAWPYVLADLLDYEVYNMGQSGCSNASIVRRTLEELSQNSYDLVIIGWTSPGRIEWKDEIGIAYDLWPGYSTSGQFFKDHPWRLDFLKYINQYHKPEYLYQKYLIQAISLQSYFKAQNIEYCMMNVHQQDYYFAVGKEQHEALANQIDNDKFIGWNEFGMIELTSECPRGNGGHPLEKGHRLIAEKFNEYIRNISRLS